MAGHHATQPRLAEVIGVQDLEMWTVAQFAAVLGRSDYWVRSRIDGDVIRLPGCVDVPLHKEGSSTAVVYRAQYLDAVRQAPTTVHKWDPDRQTTVEEPTRWPAGGDP